MPNPPVNDELFSRGVKHSLLVKNLETHQVGKTLREFNDTVVPELTSTLKARLEKIKERGYDSGVFSTDRYRKMVDSANGVLAGGLAQTQSKLVSDLKHIAVREADFHSRLLANAVPLDVDFFTPNVATLSSAIKNRPMSGKRMREWFHDLTNSSRRSIEGHLRAGLAAGESTDQIVRRIRGSKALNYADGAVGQTRRHLSTIVRTGVNHTQNQARLESFAANSDVIRGWVHVSVVDGRTSVRCIDADGKEYPLGKGEPPPLHPNCRSSVAPVVRGFKELGKELGIPLKDIPPGTRATLNGQLPSNLSARQILDSSPPRFQDLVLGKRKGQLLREGKLTGKQLSKANGRALSIDEIMELDDDFVVQSKFVGTQDDRIAELIRQLEDTSDPTESKRLRGKLRRLGHKGGTKGGGVNPPPKPPPPAPPPITPDLKSVVRDSQVEDVLNRLSTATDKREKARLRAKLRKLGHKGGTSNQTIVSPTPIAPVQPVAPPPVKLPPKATVPPSLKKTPSHKSTLPKGSGLNPDSPELKSLINEYKRAKTVDQRRAVVRKASRLKIKPKDFLDLARAKASGVAVTPTTAPRAAGVLSGKEIRVKIQEKFGNIASSNKQLKDQLFKESDELLKQLNIPQGAPGYLPPGSSERIGLVRKLQEVQKDLTKISKAAKRSSTPADVRAEIHRMLKVDDPTEIVLKVPGISGEFKEKAEKGAKFLSSITSKRRIRRMEVQVGRLDPKGRAYAENGKILLSPKDGTEIFAHEMAHNIEFQDGRALSSANRFLRQRANADPRGRRVLFKHTPDEQGWHDEFIDAYMGRDYNGRATELTSMGVEFLYKDPLKLINGDPAYFDWLIDMLRGL